MRLITGTKLMLLSLKAAGFTALRIMKKDGPRQCFVPRYGPIEIDSRKYRCDIFLQEIQEANERTENCPTTQAKDVI